MWNLKTKQILSTATIHLFLLLTLSPLSAGAFPNNVARGPSPLAPYELSVWTENDAQTWEIPRDEEIAQGVPVIDGDLDYQTMGDLFSQEDIEVAPDGNSILFNMTGGVEVELTRIGSSDVWTIEGYTCSFNGDAGYCEWGYLGLIKSDGFDLAEEFQTAEILYDPQVLGGIGAAGAVAVVAICVTIIVVVSICAATDVELSANANGHEVSLSC